MKRSTDRILTTHVGSLPRSQGVTDVLFARELDEVSDAGAAAAVISNAVEDVVRRQVSVGIDVVSDGEMSKISYATYIAERFSGFDGDSPREPGQDLVEFPGLLKKLAERGSTAKYRRPRCIGAIEVKNLAPLHADLQNITSAIAAAGPTEAFMNAASPGVVALFQPNDFYRTQDDYLTALAEALRVEYEAIVQAACARMEGVRGCEGPAGQGFDPRAFDHDDELRRAPAARRGADRALREHCRA